MGSGLNFLDVGLGVWEFEFRGFRGFVSTLLKPLKP